jgi:protein-export SecD/SecF family membrane protein
MIGALLLVGGVTITALRRRDAPVLDTSLYLVLPFRHRGESAPLLLNGDQCESLLHDALARWRGVELVDPLWVADARARRSGAVRVEDGVAIARRRRAGRVVMGEVWEFRDTIHVRGLLYDAGGDRLVREHSIQIAPDLSDAQPRFQELADSLLVGGGAMGTPPRGEGQLSLPAWRAFQDGFAALQRWELDSARARLEQALGIDPGYATAQLWLALVLSWAGAAPQTWKPYAAGALASDDSLTPRDRTLGEALVALAGGDYPESCGKFRDLIARDSLDFAAWYGLGDCQAQDPLVVRDSSGEGWHFRGSYEAAVSAYRRALEIVPSVHLAFRGQAFHRLPDLLYTEPHRIRHGYALQGNDTVRFGAFPAMARDTLEFVPRPLAQVVSADPAVVPATVGNAVARNREVMREIATTWVVTFPDRADAHETLGLVLETLGELTAGRSAAYSALSEIRRARATATDSAQALRLAATETRLLLKSEQIASAKALADSLKFGALPLAFDRQESEQVSAELGIQYLQAGLIAGGIGLLLVVLYCLVYYRLLGLITILSLFLSGALVYAVMVLLGRWIGLSLDMAGIAGLIIAIGITADSFVVYFERIKDEVREGRTFRSAVPRGWTRAKKTILSADAVSFLSAAILYILAVGDVKGFAFTLGLSTVLDLFVVFLVTHPLVALTSKADVFSHPIWSGLGSVARAGREQRAVTAQLQVKEA